MHNDYETWGLISRTIADHCPDLSNALAMAELIHGIQNVSTPTLRPRLEFVKARVEKEWSNRHEKKLERECYE